MSQIRPSLAHNVALEERQELILDEGVTLNKHIHSYLKDYQVDGIKFMYTAFKENRGAILGMLIEINPDLNRKG
jgi:hypothetical protein